MPGVNNPLGVVQAYRMRLTKLDTNGVPTPGAGKMYVTSSLIEITATPVYKEATEIEQDNGEGVLCVNYKGKRTLKRLDGKIMVCTPDPYLMDFLAGCSVIDPGTGPLGFQYPAIGESDPSPISIEVWSKRVDDGVLDANYPAWWHVWPRVINMTIGENKVGNNAIVPTLMFEAYENANWYDGPLNNWVGASDRCYQAEPCAASKVPTAASTLATVAAS